MEINVKDYAKNVGRSKAAILYRIDNNNELPGVIKIQKGKKIILTMGAGFNFDELKKYFRKKSQNNLAV